MDEKHVCPSCGQPVETVVRRHKTLGAWVPVWKPGPCRNTGCAAYEGPASAPAVPDPGSSAAARPAPGRSADQPSPKQP
ncbi:hypothetical protein ABZ920_20120 [Streptomyces sp. NPDC046831]|uniref:hypothetical protein n=1 Tax=Streptomyces sp. NPDC046831 TaxID=3154805 RepID=UPI0033D088E9